MKNTILLLLVGSLTACGPFIDTKHGIVSGGFMSSTQGFSGKMKALDGSSVAWSIVGTDSTSVPNNALGTISTVSAGNNLFKTVNSNNTNKTAQKLNASNAVSTDLKTTTGAASADLKTTTQANNFGKLIDSGAITPGNVGTLKK